MVLDVTFKHCGTEQDTAFSVMMLKVQVFWDVMLCCKASHLPCSEGASCLHFRLDSEGEGAYYSFETLENLCPRAVSHTRRHDPLMWYKRNIILFSFFIVLLFSGSQATKYG